MAHCVSAPSVDLPTRVRMSEAVRVVLHAGLEDDLDRAPKLRVALRQKPAVFGVGDHGVGVPANREDRDVCLGQGFQVIDRIEPVGQRKTKRLASRSRMAKNASDENRSFPATDSFAGVGCRHEPWRGRDSPRWRWSVELQRAFAREGSRDGDRAV